MNFLNPLLLIGALGLALPIIAHLLNRYEVRKTDWAAMQFLNRNMRVQSRKIRLRDLLLLLVRCLALLLLIFALARPAWKGDAPGWLPGEARAGVVIAIDSSFSMGHGEAGSTRFDEALKRVEVVRGRMAPGDPVTLVLLGDDHRVVLRNMAYDRGRFSEALEAESVGPGSLDLGSVPKVLAALIEDMEAAQKEVYLITDGQAKDWSQPSAQLREGLAALGESAEVFVVPVAGGPENLAVTDLELVSGVLRKGTTARYRATVRNCGETAVSNVLVQGRVDGVQIDSKLIPVLEAGASESVSLFVPFHNAGPTRITAEITGDQLAADNVRRTVAVVRDRVSVLCVDGSAGDAGRVVVASLLARPDGVQSEDYIVRSVPWLSFPAEDLSKVDVIIFADVPEITEEQSRQLGEFVRNGNGFVWFGGENVKASEWNERAASGEAPLLPATIGSVTNTSDALGAGKPLDPSMPDHNVCLPLLSLPEDLFSETRFLRQMEVEPRASSFTLLTLAGDGGPILLEQSLGRGHVFMFTTTAETSWNNMALTPVFPLVMQQMVTYLAGREFERPRTVGDSLALTYVEQPDASDAVFETPSGEVFTVPVSESRGQYVAMLEKGSEAGFYLARVSVQAPGVPIAVNVDPDESVVACLPDAELRANLEGLGLNVTTGDAELGATIESTRTGRSAWRVFMIMGLALLIAESLFADRMSLRGRAKQENLETPVPQDA